MEATEASELVVNALKKSSEAGTPVTRKAKEEA
jgi:hypothetical protein